MNVSIVENAKLDVAGAVRNSEFNGTPGAVEAVDAFVNRSTRVFVGSIEGKVVCICGVIQPSLLSDRGYLWLVVTNFVEQYKFIFIRQSQLFIQALLKEYSVLYGHVETRNCQGAKWLRFLGARFMKDVDGMTQFEIHNG